MCIEAPELRYHSNLRHFKSRISGYLSAYLTLFHMWLRWSQERREQSRKELHTSESLSAWLNIFLKEKLRGCKPTCRWQSLIGYCIECCLYIVHIYQPLQIPYFRVTECFRLLKNSLKRILGINVQSTYFLPQNGDNLWHQFLAKCYWHKKSAITLLKLWIALGLLCY